MLLVDRDYDSIDWDNLESLAGYNMYLGADKVDAMYLGANEIDAAALGADATYRSNHG